MPNEQLKTLEDKLSYAYDTKVAIHDAIVAKGVDIPEGTVFRDYASKIGEIETGAKQEFVSITVSGTNNAASAIKKFSYLDKEGTLVTTEQTDSSKAHNVPKNTMIYFYMEGSGTVSFSVGSNVVLNDGSGKAVAYFTISSTVTFNNKER